MHSCRGDNTLQVLYTHRDSYFWLSYCLLYKNNYGYLKGIGLIGFEHLMQSNNDNLNINVIPVCDILQYNSFHISLNFEKNWNMQERWVNVIKCYKCQMVMSIMKQLQHIKNKYKGYNTIQNSSSQNDTVYLQ